MNYKIKILFVVKDIDIEHIGIMLLSSILKKNGHRVDIVEAKYKKIYRRLISDNYSILAYSCPTILFDFLLSINKQIKRQFNILSVFGGPHPTAVPEIIEEESIDCICRSEGEYAFLELAEAISMGMSINNIKNLWVKENGRIYKNPLRPLIDELDSLPFPDRELFPFNETFYKGKMHVLTSRGCFYNCTYCSHPLYDNLYNGKNRLIRRRSVDNVIDEINQVKSRAPIKFVMFEDDLFISSSEWISEFCQHYEKKVRIPFFCYVRANLINEEIVTNLKRAGCIGVSMGLETADDRLRNVILKRAMSKDEIIHAARLIKKAGLRLETTNIIGIPTGSLSIDLDTLKLNIQCKVDYSSVKLLMPYPKTEIQEFSKQRELLLENYSFSNWKSPLKFVTSKEKYATENLHKLFALTAEFPFLFSIVTRIIILPLGWLYTFINLLWEGYTSFFRLYPTGWNGFWWGIKKYIRIFKEVG